MTPLEIIGAIICIQLGFAVYYLERCLHFLKLMWSIGFDFHCAKLLNRNPSDLGGTDISYRYLEPSRNK